MPAKGFTLDDTAQYYDHFGSDCSKCMFFHGEDTFTCKAFPEGVPIHILGGVKHRKPLPTQKNSIVFKQK